MGANQTAIPQNIVSVLSSAIINGDSLTLTGQLDRKTYVQVNEVITRFGGKWNTKRKAHIFSDVEDVAGAIDEACVTGEMPRKNALAYWPTPDAVVDVLMELAGPYQDGQRWLEPSAGEGAIVKGMNRKNVPWTEIDAVELDGGRYDKLRTVAPGAIRADFLASSDRLRPAYDRIVMNPPFAVPDNGSVYVEHILKAHELLAEDGILVSVAPLGLTFATVNKVARLRQLVEKFGEFVEIEDDAFKGSGTLVRTIIAVIRN